MAPSLSHGWLAAALTVSMAVVLAAPFIGQVRTVLRRAAGSDERFVLWMVVLVGGAALAVLALAAARITSARPRRYAALLVAAAIAVSYAYLSRTGNPGVDAVERFHFLEYGLITLLFYKAWRPAADGSVFVLPILASLMVGIGEEWLQWFIPARIGELRDVLLNLAAIAAGLSFSVGLDPPSRVVLALTPASRRLVGGMATAAVVLLGGFLHAVHLGHEIADREAGVFYSRYTATELAELSAARADAWRRDPPLTWSRFSREDQYLSEGLAHVQRRNEAWQRGHLLAARHENLILEKYYAPVLDTPSFTSPTGHRWPAAQRAQAESSGGPGFMIYASDALPYPVFTVPAWALWLGVLVAALGILRGLAAPAAEPAASP